MKYDSILLFLCCGLPVVLQAQLINETSFFIPNITTYRITVQPLPPWVMMTDDGGYEGFLVDVLDHLAYTKNFDFDIHIVKSGQYGMQSSYDGSWTGMIGELVNDEADIAAGAMIVTEKRKTAVTFSRVFQTTGQRILIKKPVIEHHSLKVLFMPLKVEVWAMVFVIYVITALFLFIINKISPTEWSKISNEDDKTGAKNSFDLRNCFFYIHSTLTLQGYKEAPRSPAGRILTCCWFSCVYLLLAAYIANLAAFFIAKQPEKPIVPFKTFQEMAEQSEVSYGAVSNHRTLTFMKDSSDPMVRRMYATQSANVRDIDEAISKVRKGNFAAIVDSLLGQYAVSNNCDLMLVGEQILEEGLAFACRMGTTICNELSEGILDLRESGEMHKLHQEWWYRKGKCPEEHLVNYISKEETAKLSPQPLLLSEVSLAFLLLLIGYVLGGILLVVEVLVYRFKRKREGASSAAPVQMTDANGRDQQSNDAVLQVTTDNDDSKAPIAAAEPNIYV